jgi:hypothetical protein
VTRTCFLVPDDEIACAAHRVAQVAQINSDGDDNMTKKYNPAGDLEVPKAIARFIKCPRLLPTEDEMHYWEGFDALMEDVVPATNSEWFALNDMAGLLWDIQRQTAWKNAILTLYRRSALETALRDTHRARPVVGDAPAVIHMARQEAEEWRTDPEKRKALDARLAEGGYDEDTLNAVAFLEAMEPLSKIERFLSSARGQLNALLREVHGRREFAERARKAFEERLKAVESTPKPKQIGPN